MQDGHMGIISSYVSASLCGITMNNDTEYMVFGKSLFF